MKKSKLLSLIMIVGALGLAIGGANLNRKVAPAVFAHHEDHITHEVEGHSKVGPTLTPKELVIPTDGVPIGDVASFRSFFDGGAGNRNKNAYLTADIDFGGISLGMGMADSFTGIFEGNYFTLSNYTATNTLFNMTSAASEIRNVNFRTSLPNGHTAVVAYLNNGPITNVNIEVIITTDSSHKSAISRVGNGSFVNCHVDMIFEGNGVNATWQSAISFEAGTNITNCSYYVNVATAFFNAPAGITVRTEPLEWGGVIPPRVEVLSGYVKKIYVEEEPSSTEITAEVLNTEETPTWSISDLVGGAFGDVDIDEDGVATVSALAKGTVSFKFKATIDETDYLSSLVTIKVLNNSIEYDIPEDAHEIKDRASFESFFQGSGVNNGTNAYLSADVDLGGKDFDLGMAGSFSAILEGQGYTISNFTANRLFHFTTSTAEIRNLNLVFTTKENVTGSAALAYENGGLVQKVKTTITVSQGVHTYAGIALTGGGLFENCHSDFIVKSTNSHSLYPIAQDDGGKTLTGCTWTLNGAEDSVMSIGSNVNKTRDLVREGALGFQLLVMGYEGGDIATEECAAKWSAANTKWNAISADSRQQVRTIAEFEDAWLRYQHWALANGSTPDAGSGSGLKTNNNLNITATIIIGAIGLTTLVGYYFINKKKVHA